MFKLNIRDVVGRSTLNDRGKNLSFCLRGFPGVLGFHVSIHPRHTPDLLGTHRGYIRKSL